MRPKWQLTLIAVAVAVGVSWGIWYSMHRVRNDRALRPSLDNITTNYRRIIVLMDGAENLDAAMRARCRSAGRRIFWEKQAAIAELAQNLETEPRNIRQVIDYLRSSSLRDADRLAFLDLFEELAAVPAISPGVKSELDN